MDEQSSNIFTNRFRIWNTKVKYLFQFSIKNNQLVVALDKVDDQMSEQIIAAKPRKVIMPDNLSIGIDQLKTNTVLQMRDAGIDFKTI